jgi:hypothetical protein
MDGDPQSRDSLSVFMGLTLRRAKGFVENKRDWKAVLKTPQSKRYRDCQATTNLAKRLECGRFTAALGRATLSHSHFFTDKPRLAC